MSLSDVGQENRPVKKNRGYGSDHLAGFTVACWPTVARRRHACNRAAGRRKLLHTSGSVNDLIS
jgi:hypothetical protein